MAGSGVESAQDGRKLASTVTTESRFAMIKEPSMRRTGNRLWLAAGLVAVSLWPGVAVAASSITGTVTFDGKAPKLNPLAMDADPVCAKKHPTPALSEMLVLGSGNTMGNVMVWVSKGLPAGKAFPIPNPPSLLDPTTSP